MHHHPGAFRRKHATVASALLLSLVLAGCGGSQSSIPSTGHIQPQINVAASCDSLLPGDDVQCYALMRTDVGGGRLFDGGATFASRIALAAQELNNPVQAGPSIAPGLVLFVLTFAVNSLERLLVAKKEYYS